MCVANHRISSAHGYKTDVAGKMLYGIFFMNFWMVILCPVFVF